MDEDEEAEEDPCVVPEVFTMYYGPPWEGTFNKSKIFTNVLIEKQSEFQYIKEKAQTELHQMTHGSLQQPEPIDADTQASGILPMLSSPDSNNYVLLKWVEWLKGVNHLLHHE